MEPSSIEDIYRKIKKILCYTIKSGDKKLERKPGTFELIGCDFMIDDKFKVYLIEMNSNPAITLDTSHLAEIIPFVVYSTLDLIIKINDRVNKLDEYFKSEEFNPKPFTVLINEAKNYSYIQMSLA